MPDSLRVEPSADYSRIAALVHRYPELIDAGDFDGVARLFEYARLGSGSDGSTDLADLLRGMVHTYEDGRTCTRHLVTNLTISVASDRMTAEARSYITVLQARPDFPLQVIASNTHLDRFERIDGEWRFAERVDVPGLRGDLSHHVKGSYP